MSEFRFYHACVNWPEDDVDDDGGLCDMIATAKPITRSTLLQHVDRIDLVGLETDLGYEQHHARGLTMSRDWHVGYYRSTLHGRRVYFFTHSAIEYVFTQGGKP